MNNNTCQHCGSILSAVTFTCVRGKYCPGPSSAPEKSYSVAYCDPDSGQWEIVTESQSVNICRQEYETAKSLGLSARLYKSERTSVPESINYRRPRLTAGYRSNNDVQQAMNAYIQWLRADPSRTAYVFPWTKSQGRMSDQFRRQVEGLKIPYIEVDPTDYDPKLYGIELESAESDESLAA